jgi:hypothetical protein
MVGVLGMKNEFQWWPSSYNSRLLATGLLNYPRNSRQVNASPKELALAYCQTGLSILQARDRCDAHTEETRIPKINRTPQIATVADSHMMAERQRRAYHNTDS